MANQPTGSTLSYLESSVTGERYDADVPQNLSREGMPLLARYDFDRVKLTKEKLSSRPATLWRYKEVLPVRDEANIICLGEGWTPLFHSERLGASLKMPNLYVKDESLNPTASFKARGMAVAISRAKELGSREFGVGTAGNAGSALAAYAAAGGLTAHIAMPDDTPCAFIAECEVLGADLTLVKGLITDANRKIQEGVQQYGWFDVATLREPYRIEGKKTMGYELAEQMNWSLPDVIIYPTGGGTGLIGMWKAFDEMEQLGWIGSQRPRMVSVQSEGCAPIVRAFEQGETHAEMWQNAATMASGLRVPRAIGDFLMLDAIRKSGGTAVAVSEEAIHRAWGEMGAQTGIMVAPEGAATLAALWTLIERGQVQRDERVVLFNTGSGLKYTEAWLDDKA